MLPFNSMSHSVRINETVLWADKDTAYLIYSQTSRTSDMNQVGATSGWNILGINTALCLSALCELLSGSYRKSACVSCQNNNTSALRHAVCWTAANCVCVCVCVLLCPLCHTQTQASCSTSTGIDEGHIMIQYTNFKDLKGTVWWKKNVNSATYSYHSKSVWLTFFLLWNAKEYILKNVNKQTVLVSVKKMGIKTVWLLTLYKISSFVLSRGNKLKQVWNDARARMITNYC